MKVNKFLLILIMLSCMFFLTGCYSFKGVETKAYPVAIGIDKRTRKYNKTFFASC